MPKFSAKSEKNLMTCHVDIQLVFRKAIEVIDFSVLCGFRNEEEQNKLFNSEPPRTHLKYPDSNHNAFPSDAIDVVPFPIDWGNISRFFQLNGVIMTMCKIYKVELSWGGDWRNFKDYPHYERAK